METTLEIVPVQPPLFASSISATKYYFFSGLPFGNNYGEIFGLFVNDFFFL